MEVLRLLGSSERSVATACKGVETVCTLLDNIARAPENEKFRQIRKRNPTIARLLGVEEEGVLRSAGFEDGPEETLVCLGAAPELPEVLKAAAVIRDTLRQKEAELGGEGAGALLCSDSRVAQAIECAVLDYAAQRSADMAEAEKKRRRVDEADGLRSPTRWRETLAHAGGGFLCDGGMLEAWLDEASANRSLAFELLQLQDKAMRWYTTGARRHCESFRGRLLDAAKTLQDTKLLKPLITEELAQLREAVFSYPEEGGAPPRLFREAAMMSNRLEADKDIELMPKPHQQSHEVISLE